MATFFPPLLFFLHLLVPCEFESLGCALLQEACQKGFLEEECGALEQVECLVSSPIIQPTPSGVLKRHRSP